MQSAPKPGYQATDGAAYQVFLGRWTERLADAMLGIVEIPADGALLDVGCGTGSLAFAMANRWPGRQVNGVDISEPYVAFARSAAVSGHPVFDLADICSLPYADGAFAGSIAQLVLSFVPDPAVALAEMRRVTRPGRLVGATVWDFRGGLVYQRVFWDTATVLDPTCWAARLGRLLLIVENCRRVCGAMASSHRWAVKARITPFAARMTADSHEARQVH
jgi:ubiquinone/menaquinone biosynthesis C-methylase UbiE